MNICKTGMHITYIKGCCASLKYLHNIGYMDSKLLLIQFRMQCRNGIKKKQNI